MKRVRVRRRSFLWSLASCSVAVFVTIPCAWGQAVVSVGLRDVIGARFVANAGQWPEHVKYSGGWGGLRTWISDDALTLQARDGSGRSGAVRLRIAGTAALRAEGVERLAGEHHYILGPDPDGWTRKAASYGSVVLEAPAGGPRLRVRPSPRGVVLQVEMLPGAPSRELVLEPSGGSTGPRGASMAFETPVGDLLQVCRSCSSPGASCSSCHGGLRPAADGTLRWTIPAGSDEAFIGLEWSTLLGGEGRDACSGVARAGDGSIVVAGHTTSHQFPTTPGAFDTTHAPPNPFSFNHDLFVARLTADGAGLLWSTYLGGAKNDECRGLVLHEGDEPVVIGWTGSPDYPTTPGAFSTTYPIGLGPCIVTRLSSDGSELVFSTFLGGKSIDSPWDIVIAHDGGIIVAGLTESPDFPVTPGALQTMHVWRHGFATKVTPDGSSLVFSALLGAGNDRIDAIALFPDDTLALAGRAGTAEFPTTPGGLQDCPGAFVARMASDGSELLWSTCWGGNAPKTIADVAVDGHGTVTVVGSVHNVHHRGIEFPTTEGAFDPDFFPSASWTGFVSRIDATGSELLTSTFFGSAVVDDVAVVSVDPGGVITIAGRSGGTALPVTDGAFDTTAGGGRDMFVARLSPQTDRLFYCTYVGGSHTEVDLGIEEMDMAVGPDGEVVLVGISNSSDYPTTPGALQPVDQPLGDAVITNLTLLPAGVVGLGHQTPGCAGSLRLGVTAMPRVGSKDFGFWSSGAPAFAPGLLALSRQGLADPLQVLGVALFLDPGAVVPTLFLQGDELGHAELPLPIPDLPALAGHTFFAQAFFLDPCTAHGLAASRALEITLQP